MQKLEGWEMMVRMTWYRLVTMLSLHPTDKTEVAWAKRWSPRAAKAGSRRLSYNSQADVACGLSDRSHHVVQKRQWLHTCASRGSVLEVERGGVDAGDAS